MLTEEYLNEVYKRWKATQNGPWKAYLEGRDHTSGSDFIMTGSGENREEDIELLGGTKGDYDFIANAKQDIPKLLHEIVSLRNIILQE